MRRDPWQALADPTRREILNILSESSHTVNEVAEHFSLSRPAISKQLRILCECGLVDIESDGRNRICRLEPRPLKEVLDWVIHYEQFWMHKLDKLDEYLSDK